MRWFLSLSALLASSGFSLALAQQPPAPAKSADPRVTPTTLRLPDLDQGETVTITGMVPIPNVGGGAPLFTSLDLKTMGDDAQKVLTDTRSDFRKCGAPGAGIIFRPTDKPTLSNLLAQEYEAGTRVAATAGNAQLATEKAEASRRDAAMGRVDMKVVEDAELERQAAITTLQKARADLVEAQAMIGDFQNLMLGQQGKFGIEWGDLEIRALSRQKEGVGLGIAVPEDQNALAIQNIQASQHKDKKGKDIVVVRGEIANTGRKSQALPALSVSLVDDRGWILVSSTVSAPGARKSIGAGKTQAFAVEVRPAPELLNMAVVTFAAKHAAQPRMNVGLFCR